MATLFELSTDALKVEQALEEAGGELTPELEQKLNENQQAITAKIDTYNSILRKNELTNEAIDAEIKRLQELKKSNINKIKSLKEYIHYVMNALGIEKIEGTFCKVSKRRTTAVEIDEEVFLHYADEVLLDARSKLPAYCKLEVKADKAIAKDVLKNGGVVPGARVVENENIIIK